MKIPKLIQQPIIHVDATPDEDYQLRILRAYRQNCDCMFAEDTSGNEPTNPILKQMNEDNRKRAEILDKSIALLETNIETIPFDLTAPDFHLRGI